MQNIMNNKLIKYFILLFIALLSVEVIFRIVSDIPVFDWALLRIMFGLSAMSLIVSFIISHTNKTISKIVILIIAFAAAFYATLQAGFANFLGVYVSVGTSSQLGAVKNYIGDYLKSFKLIYITIFIPFVILLAYLVFFDRTKKTNKKTNENKKVEKIESDDKIQNNLNKFIVVLVIVVLCFSYNLTLSLKLMQNKLQLQTTESLFKNPAIPNIAVKEFGITCYGLIDIKSTIFKPETTDETEDFENENRSGTVTAKSRVFDDSAWESLIENETDADLNKLNNYFMTRKITDKNDYTGMFKDKNLVLVMLESVNTLAIDEKLYPTLYKLYNEGWAWENAYSPRNACSTGNNEMSGMTSLFTINNVCTANKYKDNKYPESLYNLFNQENYLSTSYHNYNDTYYYRRTYMSNFGSQKYYDMDALGIKNSGAYSDWPSDIELVQKAVPKFIESDKFFSFMITVSAHHPYSNPSVVGDTYYNISDAPTPDLKRYMSKLKYADLALKELMDSLAKAGKLDDTVIVLYADHYPYGFKTTELQKMFDYNLEDRKQIDKTPFIIYNSKLTPKKFDEYTTYMNITPTIANLFGLDYDPRLYAGEDILDPNYSNIAIFADGSWQSDIAYYEATTGKVEYMGSKKYTDLEILEINKSVSNKIKMSNLAIQKNYFEYLNKKLEKNKQISNQATSE